MADSIDALRSKYFQSQRENVKRDINQNVQQGENALNRRFASLGLSGSGAAISASLQNKQKAAELGQRAMNDISNQETQANLASAEAEKGRQFQAGEAEKGRQFAAGESRLGREFGAGEAEKGRQFQQGLANQDINLKREFFNTEQGNKLKQLDLAERSFQLEKDAQEFNKRLAEIQSAQNTDVMARNRQGLLGMGGFLGTGLGGEKGLLGTGILSGGK